MRMMTALEIQRARSRIADRDLISSPTAQLDVPERARRAATSVFLTFHATLRFVSRGAAAGPRKDGLRCSTRLELRPMRQHWNRSSIIGTTLCPAAFIFL